MYNKNVEQYLEARKGAEFRLDQAIQAAEKAAATAAANPGSWELQRASFSANQAAHQARQELGQFVYDDLEPQLAREDRFKRALD